MNISISRMKPVSRELAGVRLELQRIADCFEMLLAHNGIHVKKHPPDTSGEEPGVFYTSEEADVIRELEEIRKGISREE